MSVEVSVIIPVFNRRRQLRKAVESVLLQDGCEFELIVIDDGSEDDLSEVKSLVESSGHIFVRTENRGVAAARNYGVSLSCGRYLAFLDSDDVWLPGKLFAQLNYFKENPTIRICQTKEIWFRNGRRVNPKLYHQMPDGEAFFSSLQRCVISPSSVMLERSLFDEVGGFDESLVVCEDYDLWLRISSKYPVGLVYQELCEKFGGHDDQLSKSQPVMDRYRVLSIMKLLSNGDLSDRQVSDAVSVLKKKAKIIADGAYKRGASFYETYDLIWEDLEDNSEKFLFNTIDEAIKLVRGTLDIS